MTQSVFDEPAVYSSLGNDPNLGELVEMFVEEMPDRINTLTESFESGDKETLRRLAHQLKGALGSYGFDQLTPYAAKLERIVCADGANNEIRQSLNDLVNLCRKVRARASK